MAYRQRQSSYARQAPPRRQPQPERRRLAQQTKPRPKPRIKPSQPTSGGLFSAKLVAALFFVFVFSYIGHSIWDFMTPGVNTMIVRMSTMESPRSIPGLIIRTESVHYADRAGNVEFWVQENQRIYVGAHVASIQDSGMVRSATAYLSGVETQALNLQTLRPASYGTAAGIQRFNNNMTNMINNNIHSFTALSLSEIYALRDNLSHTINARNQINIGDALAAREPLAREHERHMSAYGINSANMRARTSGIVSRFVDGREATLTLASISELTREDIRETTDYDIITPSQEVQSGDAVFKIVGNVWYIASYMPTDMIEGFTVGSMQNIYLHNDNTGNYEPHTLRIESIEYGARYSLVVFRNTRHVIDFISQRNISIRTSSGTQRGFQIPDTAILTRHHYRIPLGFIHGETERYVLIFTETGNIMVPVTYDESTDYHAYIPDTPGLTIGSILVPRDPYGNHFMLSDSYVRVIHGVYAVVLGAVAFRHIDLGDSSVEGGYVWLDPSLSHGISEFSNIITNASTVVAGQIIR